METINSVRRINQVFHVDSIIQSQRKKRKQWMKYKNDGNLKIILLVEFIVIFALIVTRL